MAKCNECAKKRECMVKSRFSQLVQAVDSARNDISSPSAMLTVRLELWCSERERIVDTNA